MKREEKSREKIEKHPRLQLWRPSYRTKVFPNSPPPFPFLESIPFIAFQRCPVVNQSARGKILVRVHELVYPLTRLKFISWFVDAPSRDVGGWMVSTVKQVAIATRASFTSALNPPTNPNPQPPRVFYPCIPQFLPSKIVPEAPASSGSRRSVSTTRKNSGEWKTRTGSSRINAGWLLFISYL